MAGSLSHIVDDETGQFRMSLIENLGDAHEALDECFKIIHRLTQGNRGRLNMVLLDLNFPPIEVDMRLGGDAAI